MTSSWMPSQKNLNAASFEELETLMDRIYNTYKIKVDWGSLDRESLKEKCADWEIADSGKSSTLTKNLQNAYLEWLETEEHEEQGPTATEATHPTCWSADKHYGQCGQSCPCCRAEIGDNWGACMVCSNSNSK